VRKQYEYVGVIATGKCPGYGHACIAGSGDKQIEFFAGVTPQRTEKACEKARAEVLEHFGRTVKQFKSIDIMADLDQRRLE
jgi:hypothetical protein